MSNTTTFYNDIPNVRIKTKIPHIRKIGGKLYRGFCIDYGDIPVTTYNEITHKFEEVVNNRGFGYAHRNALRYRNKKVK